MNKEDYNKLSTFDKLDYDISMEIYFKHNDKIASINDHLGEIFGYSDLRDAEEYELKDELEHYRGALKEKCDAIDKAIEYIAEELLTYDNESDEFVVGSRTIQILKGEENEGETNENKKEN